MITYVFRDDPVTIRNASKADPQKIGEALAEIKAKHGGDLRPRYVWSAVKDHPRHPLHKHFQWDVQKAAEAHWTDQARELIRVVRVVDSERPDDPPVPAFISVSDKGGASYRSASEIRSSAYYQHIVMKQALRDLESWQRRYRELSDVCPMVSAAAAKLRQEVEHDKESRAA